MTACASFCCDVVLMHRLKLLTASPTAVLLLSIVVGRSGGGREARLGTRCVRCTTTAAASSIGRGHVLLLRLLLLVLLLLLLLLLELLLQVRRLRRDGATMVGSRR